MKRLLIPAILVLIFTGCCEKIDISPSGGCKDVHYTKTTCPKFNAKLHIDVKEINSTHASILWTDVSKIEALLKQKKRFNTNIELINSKK